MGSLLCGKISIKMERSPLSSYFPLLGFYSTLQTLFPFRVLWFGPLAANRIVVAVDPMVVTCYAYISANVWVLSFQWSLNVGQQIFVPIIALSGLCIIYPSKQQTFEHQHQNNDSDDFPRREFDSGPVTNRNVRDTLCTQSSVKMSEDNFKNLSTHCPDQEMLIISLNLGKLVELGKKQQSLMTKYQLCHCWSRRR